MNYTTTTSHSTYQYVFITHNYYISQHNANKLVLKLDQQDTNNSIFTFIATLIVSLLQLKYQGDHVLSPFDTNPTTMFLAIVSLALYCATYATTFFKASFLPLSLSTTNYIYSLDDLCQKWMTLFGSMALASFGSLLFSTSSQRYALYALCAIFGLVIVIICWGRFYLDGLQRSSSQHMNLIPLHMREL